jgi:HK97 family phage portal protein
MKLIDKIFDKLGFVKKQNTTYVNFLDGNGAFYNQFGDNIYASDVVQQAIGCIVSEMKKLNPMHVVVKNGEDTVMEDQIQKVLDNPNPLMTTSYYIEKMMWNLFLNYNAFAYPLWEGDKLVSITPLQPTDVEFTMTPNGEMWIHMEFKNGYKADLPYDNVIHIRRNYSVSDVMGGNEKGQPDNAALLETIKLNDKLLKGLAKQMDMQMNVQGIIKYKTTVGKEDPFVAVKEFEDKVRNYETAFLPVDNSAEITTLTKQLQMLDKTVLEFLDLKILRQYGVSVPIVTGDFNTEQFNAFYQKTLEPLAIDFSQTHTKALFSKKESFGYGHKIKFFPKEMLFMGTQQKLEYFKILVDIGGCYKNEVRTAFGNKPLKELEGQIAVSSNQQNAVNNKKDGEVNE